MYCYGRALRWTRTNDDRVYEHEGIERFDLASFRLLTARNAGDVNFDTVSTPQVIRGAGILLGISGFQVARTSSNLLLLGHAAASAAARWTGNFAVRFE